MEMSDVATGQATR